MIATENLKGRSGVYCAIHRDSLKCYVGSSVNMELRRKCHVNNIRRGIDTRFYRYAALNGVENFDFEVLEFCNREELPVRETFWINFYQSHGPDGLNTLKTAQWPVFGVVSDEIRAKISKALKGKKLSDEHRKRLSETHIGIKHTAQSRANMAAAHVGLKRSDEARANMRAAQKGRVVSEECKAKLRAFNLGKVASEESRRKQSLALRGRKMQPQVLAALVAANTGAKRSEESKARMRAARLAYLASKGAITNEN